MGCDFSYSGSQTNSYRRADCLDFVYQVSDKILSRHRFGGEPLRIGKDLVPPGSLIIREILPGDHEKYALGPGYERLDSVQPAEYAYLLEVYRVKNFSCEGVIPFSGSEFCERSQFVFEICEGNLVTLSSAQLNASQFNAIKTNFYSKWLQPAHLEMAVASLCQACSYREIYNYTAYAEFLHYIQMNYLPNLKVSDDYFVFESTDSRPLKNTPPIDMVSRLYDRWTGNFSGLHMRS